MDIGIALPNFAAGASRKGIVAAAEAASRLGWQSVWVTDHVLVSGAARERYGPMFEALTTLAWIGSRIDRLCLGTSVLVVPQRNAVILAKELATLDALSGGRVIAGVGVGWSEAEFVNLGEGDRYSVRGSYLDEAIRLWRHLWSGSQEPFEGAFHSLTDYAFGPVPPQGSALPIVVGGLSDAAIRRAAWSGDGYQVTYVGPAGLEARLPRLQEEAARAGRPLPRLSARVHVRFGDGPAEPHVLAGPPATMREGLDAWAAVGVDELIFVFEVADEEADRHPIVAAMERFDAEVLARTAA